MGNTDRFQSQDRFSAGIDAKPKQGDGFSAKGVYKFTLFRKGEIVDQWEAENVVTNEGLDDILEKYFNGSSYTSDHYVGLTDGTPTVAGGDTLSSHAGWTEITDYDEANRVALSMNAASSQSIDNNGSEATFSINATVTIGGAFVATVNSGTSGTLLSVAAFTGGDRSLQSGDTLNVEYTMSASDA